MFFAKGKSSKPQEINCSLLDCKPVSSCFTKARPMTVENLVTNPQRPPGGPSHFLFRSFLQSFIHGTPVKAREITIHKPEKASTKSTALHIGLAHLLNITAGHQLPSTLLITLESSTIRFHIMYHSSIHIVQHARRVYVQTTESPKRLFVDLELL